MRAATTEKIRVVILAGQRPGVDPVASMFNERYKAAVKIAGKTMLNRVMEAIDASGRVSDTYILLQEPEFLRSRPEFHELANRSDVHLMASKPSISESLLEILNEAHIELPLLVTTCDHVLLRGKDINAFIDAQPDVADMTVGLVSAEIVLSAYPDIQRTWLTFADGRFTSCNLFMIAGDKAKAALTFWASIEQDRKKVLYMAWRFGPLTLIGYMLKLLTLVQSFKHASKSMGADIKPILLDHADLAIDVDKKSDVEFVQHHLEQ